ncbi:hypothetical protein FGE12_08220 [Aggregicoccus sp. 17bor-14]|uniref:hypothetical protein n=1 Tax=Myxococcaceae TaxID=31 RepID=UPI00129CD417|nr:MULTISPECIES: hypothetical protein [Myxococcaceae]MBF5042382.1 hypothetical protein [Simulacricoccus sp. 17bor-14]MRI88155.1 hypothetical protein [Aggregicoccus sp. 17bor-14]
MRRIAVALGASLLVHAVLLLLLWRTPAPPRTAVPEPPAPLVFEVVERAAPSPATPARRRIPPLPPASAPPANAPTPRAAAAPPQAEASAPHPAEPPAPAPLASDAPRAPRALDLLPHAPQAPLAAGDAPRSGGRTLRPGDPTPSLEAQRAEEAARVQARLQGFGDEAFSIARARGGLPHPYLVQVREALQAGLTAAAPASPEALGYGKGLAPALQQFNQNYRAAAEEYGRTGTPGLAAPSGPTQGEKVAQLLPAPESTALRALIQITETRDAVMARAPLLALTLQLTQGRDGTLLDAAVVESSGNRLFDSLVLKVAPEALGRAGAPPPEAFRREQLRSLWRVEGRLVLSQEARESLASLLPGFNGLPTQELLQHLRGQAPTLSYGARLLRYE